MMNSFPAFKPGDGQGQKAVLVGANGIGKTTLFKSILGLTPALSGSVELGDYLSIGYFERNGSRQYQHLSG